MASMAGSSTTTLTRRLLRLSSMRTYPFTGWPWAALPSTGNSLGYSTMPATLAAISVTPERVRPWKSYIHTLQNRPDMNTHWPTCRVETIVLLIITSWKYARHVKGCTSRLDRATTRPLHRVFRRNDHSGLAIANRAHDQLPRK